MKIYLDNDCQWSKWLCPTASEEELDELHAEVKEWCDVADEMGCAYHVRYTESGANVLVFQQKCTLDEEAMNTLFDEFLLNMFDVGLAYSPIGGRGCGFTMNARLSKRKET